MRKLAKLLALTLAVIMLLPVSALAAENEEEAKELWMQWINWDEENYQPEGDGEVHRDTPQITPYDPTYATMHVAFYTCDNDGEKLTPVPADKLEADKGVTITPLCPGEKGKESYAEVSVAEWNKTYTISYNGYSIRIESRLPDIGLYSAPEATIDNYIWNQTIAFNPLSGNRSAYIISTCTDETSGRHMVDLAFAEDYADKDSFKLEKVSDNVYKVTLTGSIDVDGYDSQMTVTWQNVSFMGGNKYKEGWGFRSWEQACVLFSDNPAPEYDYEKPTLYPAEKSKFNNTLTLKAGESKTVYTAFTFFTDDHNAWIMLNLNTARIVVSDNALKLTRDSEDRTKLTLASDVPGTYTVLVYDSWMPVIDAVYHEDGTKYTEAEFKKFDDELLVTRSGEELIVVTDTENWTTASMEEAFPGKKVEYHIVEWDPWYPITVTVEAAEPEKLPFTDVAEGQWYEAAVRFVSGKGYMKGSSATTFNPSGKITGAEVTQILYNKENKPAAADGASFQGVDGKWYAPAMLWAAGQGIVTDTGDTAIDPVENVTREQIALMLYNYLGKPEGNADLSTFADADQISAWAEAAMEWAVSAKVFQGSDGKLNPTGTATRAEVAQLLMNYFGK